MNKKDRLKALLGSDKKTSLSKNTKLNPQEQRIPVLPDDLMYYHVSSMQKQYYLLQQQFISGVSYNLPHILQIEEKVDYDRMVFALQSLIDRHDILRTGFLMNKGEIVQKIFKGVKIEVQKLELGSKNFDELVCNFVKPFDLSKPPLIRAKILIESNGKYNLLLDIHHIIADEKTLYLLFKELIALYFGEDLPKHQVTYKDFASYQQSCLRDSGYEKYFDDVKCALNEGASALNLLTDFSVPSNRKYLGNIIEFKIDQDIIVGVLEKCREYSVSPFIFFLSCYFILLEKYTGQNVIAVGSSFENRRNDAVKESIGVFVNVLPLICPLKKDINFNDYLVEVRKVFFAAYDCQEFPAFELINRLSSSSNYIAQTGLFNTLFDFHVEREVSISKNGINFRSSNINLSGTKFDVSLEVVQRKKGFYGYIEYDVELFERDTINGMSQAFVSILRYLSAETRTLIKDIPIMLPSSSIDAFLTNNNITTLKNNLDKQKTFLDKFSEQANIFPNKIAATCYEQSVTYGFLDDISSKIARYLIGAGLSSEEFVIVMMDRSIEMLISLLAVMKAGGVYLPVSLDWSFSRIRGIIKNTSCSAFILDKERHLHLIPEENHCDCWQISSLISDSSQFDHIVLPKVDSFHLVYTIFTSGSTGSPKGVMIEHAGMLNHLLAKVELLGLTHNDVVAQTSSQVFDVSIWQFLAGLLVGSTIAILNDDDAWLPNKLFPHLIRKRVTVFETVPSHMRIILDAFNNFQQRIDENLLLRWLMINGEPLSPEICNLWFNIHPNIPIINAYGPTECSDDTHHFVLTETTINIPRFVPIGNVIPNLKALILDERRNILPIGVVGDLYIAGVGLARGYVNQPKLTAEAFVPLPEVIRESFSDVGNRMYKTGDKARFLANGTIELLGRADRQIKIGGTRIELGEIEKVFESFDDVKIAAAVAKMISGRKQIVLYCVSQQQDGIKLRERVSKILPSIMMPVQIVFLHQMPLLSSGKINYKGLPENDIDIIEEKSLSENVIAESLTDLQKMIVKIWRQIFNKNIMLDDNFFEIGGNSLLSLQIISALSSEAEVEISIRSLYEYPTVRKLANFIEGQDLTNNRSRSDFFPKIIPSPKDRFEPFPVTDVQQSYLIGRSGMFDLGSVSVHVYQEYDCDNIDISRLEIAWNSLIKRHDGLRIIFPTIDSQQVLSSVPYYSINVNDLGDLSQKTVDEQLMKIRQDMSHYVFPADIWPLFDIRVARLPKGNFRIFISFDVLIIDGWSSNILFKEFYSLYQNPKLKLPSLDLTFKDYIIALKDFKQSDKYLSDKKYWLDRIDAFPGAPKLPIFNIEQLTNQEFKRATASVSKNIWDKLQEKLKNCGISPTVFIATLFAEVLFRFSNTFKFVINLTLFDRFPVHPQINDIIGDFTSLILLEIDYEKLNDTKNGILGKLKIIQQQLWDDLEHSSFSGIEFLQEITKSNKGADSNILAPVVLTSILGVDDTIEEDVSKFFGKEVYSITQTPQVWLDFKAYEIQGDLIIEWDYVRDLFPEKFVDSMHQIYVEMVMLLADNLGSWDNMSQIVTDSMKTDVENKEDTKKEDWVYRHPHEFIARYAKNNPEDSAIVTTNKDWSYLEVSNIAAKLSQILIKSNILPNDLVAVILEKGAEQILAILGVLYSGAAYIPIDPTLPKARINELLSFCNIKNVITTRELLASFGEDVNAISNLSDDRVICFDQISFDNYNEKDCNIYLDINRSFDDLAYVIFTSGSTGVPKGVMIKLKAVLNTVFDINKRFGVNSNDRVLAISNFNFDLSVYDILGLLMVGGAIIVPDKNSTKDPFHWFDLIKEHHVTIWNSVPMLMQMFVAALSQKDTLYYKSALSKLRLVLMSGDWIPTGLPRQIKRYLINPDLCMMSLGGATEASIWSIQYPIDVAENYTSSIPYGYALTNQYMYVLSDGGEINPNYVVGEIYIGGEGVAEGYLNNEEQGHARFVQHKKYGKLYRTGDLGRYMNNGAIEFLGRTDTQVKINGHRIELREIEMALKKFHGDISQTIVVTMDDNRGKKQLVGYVVLEKGIQLKENDPEAVKNKLAFLKAKHGIRKFTDTESIFRVPFTDDAQLFSDAIYFARKSYRQFHNKNIIDRQIIIEWLFSNFDNKCFNADTSTAMDLKECLPKILSVFRPVKGSGKLFPKYLYPSGGSLYPIRVYVTLTMPMPSDGYKKGVYYYHPLENSLILLKELPLNKEENDVASIKVHFAVNMDAIAPIYGEIAYYLSVLEAGYMYNCLAKACAELSLGAKPQLFDNKLCFCDKMLLDLLEPSEQMIASVDITTGGKVEELANDHHPSVSLYCEPGKIKGVSGGWYRIVSESHKLEPIDTQIKFSISPSMEDTYSIFNDSDLSLIFTIPEERTDNNVFYLFQCGYISQMLMEKGLVNDIGTCAIGGVCKNAERQIEQAIPGQKFLHAIFAGGISKEQQNSTHRSKHKINILSVKLQESLRNRLPDYMVPNFLIVLDTVPLSVNGKVDLKVLPKPQFEVVTDEIIVPSSATECRVLEIWAEILQIDKELLSVTENFFRLGGTSLSLIALHEKIINVFNVDISIASLFEKATIQNLAQLIEANTVDTNTFANIADEDEQEHLKEFLKMRKNRRKRG